MKPPKNDEDDGDEEQQPQTVNKSPELPDFWNVIFLQGEINDQVALHVCERLLTIDYVNSKLENPQPVNLIINSPGGSVTSAWQICDMMDFINSDIYTVGVGRICSAGLLIFMNGTPGHRKVSDRCAIMSHRYSWGAEGKHTDLLAVRKEQDYVHQRILRHYIECTGLNKNYIEKNLLLEHDTWLTPEEAVDHKLVDSIVTTKKSKKLRKKRSKVKLKEQ